MPLIKPKLIEKEIQIRVRLTESVLKEVDDYCQWAKVYNIASLILSFE